MSSPATLPPQGYAEATRSFYEQLRSLCAGKSPWPAKLRELRELLSPLSSGAFERWKLIYRNQARTLLADALRDLGAPEDSPLREQVSTGLFYERVLPGFISSYLFWIWEERLSLSEPEQAAIVDAMLQGIIGYRLIDLHLDGDPIGPEAVVLGNHLVRTHECALAAIFGERIAWPVLNRYAKMFAEVEFLEKSCRWKPCPFSWDEPFRIGWKVAPLTAVVHLLMARAGKPRAHIETAAAAMTRMLAALQMMDDWQDAFADLSFGYETLAASGFYAWNRNQPVGISRVREFLDAAKLRRCVAGTLVLLNTAIQDLGAIGEPILAFDAELIKNQFLKRMVVTKPE